MNKMDFVDKLAERSGLTKNSAHNVLNHVVDIITEAMTEGEAVQITGFGTFDVKSRAARMGRNPHTNEEIEIPASKGVHFKPGATLKQAVRG